MLAINNQLTAEQRLSKAVVAIMGNDKYIALSGVLMIGDKTICDDVPTACTNGRDEMYGRDFIAGLTDAELRFLILHENYHKLYRHLTTWRHLYDENAQLANQACDYVINQKIADDNRDGFATVIDGALIDDKYRDMDTAQVYNLLKQDQDQDEQDSDGGQPAEGGEPMDSHDWEGAQELSEPEQRDLERDIDEAIRQGAMAAGKMGKGDLRDLNDLLTPQVDWRELLREFVQNTCTGNDYATYARPNRRLMSQGIVMPSGVSEQIGELVIAIDTSGSIGQHPLSMFLSEVRGICESVRPERVRILYWGHNVVGDELYLTHELDDLTKSTKPKGGGGTDVRCVTEYMTKEGITPQAAVVLTDGELYAGWGEWSCPVLWAVLDNDRAVPDVGKCVHIKSGDM
tara:strand:+ start:2470 stop:3672 length:1203 start_codon:yes stop_codon:yes gene_type:complete